MVEEVIEYISGFTTLLTSDVITTGTPRSIGIFPDPPELLAPGDTVDVEFEDVGTLSNPVVAERE